MQIFLSYSSVDRKVAEEIHLALVGSGHSVFFDKQSLPSAGDYQTRIRAAVNSSDFFVFLITPESVEQSSFALTELQYAREKWQHPKSRVLPVLLRPVSWDKIPTYLKAVTVLEPVGNVAAAVVSAVTSNEPSSHLSFGRIRGPVVLSLLGTIVVISAAAILLNWDKLWANCDKTPSVRLNEVCAVGKECDGQMDFVEIYNPNPTTVDLRCFAIKDQKEHRFPLTGKLEPRAAIALTKHQLGFGLSSTGDKVSLLQTQAGVDVLLDFRVVDESHAYQQRLPDGGDNWEQLTASETAALRSVGTKGGQNRGYK